jgi:hypothetical protein
LPDFIEVWQLFGGSGTVPERRNRKLLEKTHLHIGVATGKTAGSWGRRVAGRIEAASMACDLILYLLLLKEKEDASWPDCP